MKFCESATYLGIPDFVSFGQKVKLIFYKFHMSAIHIIIMSRRQSMHDA